jgi:hypothetical protein
MFSGRAHSTGDPELYLAIARVWDFGRRSGSRRFPPGVHRHASMEALNAQTRQWEDESYRRRVDARTATERGAY